MSDTEDWVDVSEPTTLATMDVADYTAFVSDTTNPAPVFKVAGLCYVLRYPNSFSAEAKAVARSHFHCNACTSRAGVYCRDLGPDGPAFFHHLNAGQGRRASKSTSSAPWPSRRARKRSQSRSSSSSLAPPTPRPRRAARHAARPSSTGRWHLRR